MKLIDSDVKLVPYKPTLEDAFRCIELAGRNCTATTPKEGITAKEFTDSLLRRGHGTPLEFGAVYLRVQDFWGTQPPSIITRYKENPFSRVINNGYYKDESGTDYVEYFITTNFRVIMQGDYKKWSDAVTNNYDKNWLNDLVFWTEDISKHDKRVIVHFTCGIDISREFNRHRANSVCEQSTRYCNYSNEKFGGDVSFIKPYWFDEADTLMKSKLLRECEHSEYNYLAALKEGLSPQKARVFLELNAKTELFHCAYEDDWEEFCKLRCDKSAHPDAQKLANQLKTLLIQSTAH